MCRATVVWFLFDIFLTAHAAWLRHNLWSTIFISYRSTFVGERILLRLTWKIHVSCLLLAYGRQRKSNMKRDDISEFQWSEAFTSEAFIICWRNCLLSSLTRFSFRGINRVLLCRMSSTQISKASKWESTRVNYVTNFVIILSLCRQMSCLLTMPSKETRRDAEYVWWWKHEKRTKAENSRATWEGVGNLIKTFLSPPRHPHLILSLFGVSTVTYCLIII